LSECATCHKPHGSDHPKLQSAAGGATCFECHDTVKAETEKSFVHGPVAQGQCVQCHNPHANSNEHLLAVPAEKLCLTCHEDILRTRGNRTHSPVADGSCALCHRARKRPALHAQTGDGRVMRDLP
jgi:predicted CXXCH cytochrome family protein